MVKAQAHEKFKTFERMGCTQFEFDMQVKSFLQDTNIVAKSISVVGGMLSIGYVNTLDGYEHYPVHLEDRTLDIENGRDIDDALSQLAREAQGEVLCYSIYDGSYIGKKIGVVFLVHGSITR